MQRGVDVLARVDLVRINDRILDAAGAMLPVDLRSLDAVHLATAPQLGDDLAAIVTYDDRMAGAAKGLGWAVARQPDGITFEAVPQWSGAPAGSGSDAFDRVHFRS